MGTGNSAFRTSGSSLCSGDTTRLVRQELQPALDAAHALPPEELSMFLGDLEIVRASAWARLIRPNPTENISDALVSVTEAARRLGVSRNYLYHHHGDFSFTRRMGGRLLFSSNGIDA